MKFFCFSKKILVIIIIGISFSIESNIFYTDSWALLIGINEYQHETPLHYAVADATEMKRLLSEKLDFPDENIVILLDDAATLQGIKRSMDELAKKSSENDRVLIYFAGHGKTKLLPNGGEEGYLIPVNGKSSDLFSTSLPMSEMKRVSDMMPAKDMLFLMDACYSGIMGIRGLSLDLNDSTPLKKIAAGGSRTVITAGKKDQIAQERPAWGHSALVKSLLYGLEKGMADTSPADGYITDLELANHVMYQVTADTDGDQTPSISHFTSDQGQFVFIIGDVDLHFKKGGENDLNEIRKAMEQLKQTNELLLKQMNELLLAQGQQSQDIEETGAQLGSEEEDEIVYGDDALEEEMKELEEEMEELGDEMAELGNEMEKFEDAIDEAEDMEEGKEEAIKHLKSEMGRVGAEMGRLGAEMGRVEAAIEGQKEDSVNDLLEKLKDLGIDSEEIAKVVNEKKNQIRNKVGIGDNEDEVLMNNSSFSKSPTWHYENNETSPAWIRYNRSEGFYFQINKTFQSEIIPGSSFYGGIGRSFHRNAYQWIFGFEQLIWNKTLQIYFEGFDKSITPDAWRVWDGENSMAAFLLKKDYLDWYNCKGFRGAGFIHIKNYFSIGVEYNQISQSSMKTVLENDNFREAYKIEKGDDNYLKTIFSLGYPVKIGARKKLQFYSSIVRTQSIGNNENPYTYDHFFLNLLAPYTHDLNFIVQILAGASDVDKSIWDSGGYHQHIFEIGGKGTLRGYDWKEFATSHYFLAALEIWYDEFGVFYDRAVIFESPGNTFNADYFSDLYDNISDNIHQSAGISLGDEDASISFIRKLNGEKDTIINLTLTFGAPLQYW